MTILRRAIHAAHAQVVKSAEGFTTPPVLQNGIHPKDTFNVVEELRRARAAHHGQKLVDEHCKQEAVLAAALHAHDDSTIIAEDPLAASRPVLNAPGMILNIEHVGFQSCYGQALKAQEAVAAAACGSVSDSHHHS